MVSLDIKMALSRWLTDSQVSAKDDSWLSPHHPHFGAQRSRCEAAAERLGDPILRQACRLDEPLHLRIMEVGVNSILYNRLL